MIIKYNNLLKNIINMKFWYKMNIEPTVSKIHSIARIGDNFLNAPNPLSAIVAVTSLMEEISKDDIPYSAFYFEKNLKWMYINQEYYNIINQYINDKKPQIQEIYCNDGIIYITTINNIKIGWLKNIQSETSSYKITRCYVYDNVNYDKFLLNLKNYIWSLYKDSSILISFDENNKTLNFNIDTLNESLSSELADYHAINIAKALAVGENRSIVFFGPPGSGKSTIATRIVNQLNLRTIKIDNKTLMNSNSNLLMSFIKMLEPECVIIDDFDRMHDMMDNMFNVITTLRLSCKLLIATANNRNSISEPLLRPGRFDELVFVSKLDDSVIKHLLGEENQDIFDIVKLWPISFIHEYNRRCKWLTKQEAFDSIKELAARVKRLEIYDINNHDNNFSNISM